MESPVGDEPKKPLPEDPETERETMSLAKLEAKVFKKQCELFDLAHKHGVKSKIVQRKIDILIRT